VDQVVARERPDVVHVQHLAFLSSGLRFDLPAVGTLHDHWPWCPAGGTMLRPGGEICPQPEPEACLRCYSAWARLPGRAEHAAVRVAEWLAPHLPPARLHALWRAMPLSLRGCLHGPPAPAGSAAAVSARRAALTAAWNALDVRMAPSTFLADEARRHGLGEVRVVPAGLDPTGPFRGGGPVVFIGSLLPHKGAHLVLEGYRAAFGGAGPGLVIFGDPSLYPAYARSLGAAVRGPLAPAAVPDTLAGATALALGSIWPENAPLVILEARAAGCPVIAPRIGGIPELVEEGRDGFLYEPGQPAALAAALRRLVAPGARVPLAVRPPPTLDEHAAAVEAVYRGASAVRRGEVPWTRGGPT
jgi:glycosyltransferase involved in cell wall biosynthesis